MPEGVFNDTRSVFTHAKLQRAIISDMKALSLNHLSHELMVVIGLKVTRLTTLPQAVVALCVEQLLLREICQLELMIDVGGNYKELAILEQRTKPRPLRCEGLGVRRLV